MWSCWCGAPQTEPGKAPGTGLWELRPRSVRPLEHVDEIAGNVGLAWLVRLEVSQDAVLAFAPKGSSEQLGEGC